MTKVDAQQQMILLLGEAVAGQLSTADQDWCVERSNSGGDYDPWLAAAEAADLLGGRAMAAGSLKQFTADGATFVRGPADWVTLAALFRAKSPRDPGFAFVIV
jgi:hypothetical protein